MNLLSKDPCIEGDITNNVSPYQLAEKLVIQGMKEYWSLQELILEVTDNWNEMNT